MDTSHDKTHIEPMSDGEYHLLKEEYLRDCTDAMLGFGITSEGKSVPAILLLKPLEDKEAYRFKDVDSWFTTAQEFGRIEYIFLDFEFKQGEGKPSKKLRICIPESMFTIDVLKWFRLLIKTDGELAINDSLDEIGAISVNGVPLDIPKILVNSAYWVKG